MCDVYSLVLHNLAKYLQAGNDQIVLIVGTWANLCQSNPTDKSRIAYWECHNKTTQYQIAFLINVGIKFDQFVQQC
jgi:hypothetical protein